jgi:hypothetical protein
MKIVNVPTGVLPVVPIVRVATLAVGSDTAVGETVTVRPGTGLPPTSGSKGARSTQASPKQVKPFPSAIEIPFVLVAVAPAITLKLDVADDTVKNG